MKTLKTEFLIIIFLWINIVTSIILLQEAELRLIFGIVGLSIVTFLYFVRNRYCSLFLVILLGFSIFNIISFNDAHKFFLSIILDFNIVSTILFVILIIKRKEEFSKLFEPSKEDIEKNKRSEIDFFKKRFENLSDKELISKLDEELVPEAKKAIFEILNDKKT